MRRCIFVLFAGIALAATLSAQDTATKRSGPQIGEKLSSFTVRGALDDAAGKEFDPVKDAEGRPLVLFFLHEVTRPGVALARSVLNYAASRKADGLDAAFVVIADDPAQAEQWINRAAGALPRGVPIGVSIDGPQGPPAYGLNRQVEVTVVVAKDNQVTANFALVQPSVKEDALKIAKAIAAAAGLPPPTAEELEPFGGGQ